MTKRQEEKAWISHLVKSHEDSVLWKTVRS